jgi:tetratricopeptide (TPR) repeat protein
MFPDYPQSDSREVSVKLARSRFSKLAWLAVWPLTVSTGRCHAQSPPPVPNATVKADALTVYADMRTSSAAIASLKRGDAVIVDFEFKTSAEKWCRLKQPSAKMRLGYVPCAALDRKEESSATRRPASGAGSTDGMANRAAANNLPIAPPPPPRSASGYDEIASLVVREGLIDVAKLAEYDAAGRGGAVAPVRRAALAHYAAGNFELSRNSFDEAIEQYQAALPFAGKHPDLLTATLVRLAIVHLHRSEYSAALEYLNRARGAAPNSVAVARLSGWAYYGLDRLDEAVAQWKFAQKIEPDANVQRLLEKAETDREAESGFRSGQTNHFTLHYEGSATPQLAADILRALEDDFRSIQSELRFAPQEPVAVVLYTQQNFRDITRAPSWAGAWNDGRIRVPVQGVTSVSDPLSRILKHELTHSFVRQKTQGHCPQWLHEGLAQWMEGRRSTDSARPLLEAYDHQAAPPLKALEGSWADYSGKQAGMAYAWSLAAVEFIVANSGMWGVERLLDSLASGTAIEPALGSALQTNYTDIQRATADYLRRTYAR